jgi:hypothetical protein
VRRIATDKLREAFAEVPEANGGSRRLANPVSANATRGEVDQDGTRKRGDLMSEKIVEQ